MFISHGFRFESQKGRHLSEFEKLQKQFEFTHWLSPFQQVQSVNSVSRCKISKSHLVWFKIELNKILSLTYFTVLWFPMENILGQFISCLYKNVNLFTSTFWQINSICFSQNFKQFSQFILMRCWWCRLKHNSNIGEPS